MKKLFALITAVPLLFCACGNGVMKTEDIFAMDTFMTLKAYGKNADEALSASSAEIKRLEDLLSVTKENSDISNINSGGGKPVPVSSDTLNVINTALEIGEKTDGALDITIYPLLTEWGFTTGEYKIPDEKKLKELLKRTDYGQVVTTKDSVKLPDGFRLDLGAVAKGYAGDRAAEIIREAGVTSAIISLGGSVQAIGLKPDGSPWKVGIADPFSPNEEIAAVSVSDKAVVTSGNYNRYFEGEDGKRYCHIISPYSGYPVDNGTVSVTVIGSSGAECDALSTALFVMGYEKAAEYYRENRSFDMVLITSDGKIHITEGLKNSVITAEDSGAEVEVIE